MITQELTAYVKSELNKGKSKEEIRTTLLSGGGWNEEDMVEVFKSIMPTESTAMNIPPNVITPIQNPVPTPAPSFISPHDFVVPAPMKKSRSFPWKTVIFALIFGGLCFAGWYYRASLSLIPSKISSSFSSLFNSNSKAEKPIAPVEQPIPTPQTPPTQPAAPVAPENSTAPVVLEPIDCGMTTTPDRKSNSLSLDSALKCFGEGALVCRDAQLVINDSFFPTILKISNKNNSCVFSLAYASDSTLVDVTGKKLAGRSMSCPVSIVKSMDESNPKSILFKNPNTSNAAEYTKDIYFYGTLGVFIENNFNQMKIESLGCNGSFVNSMIESYQMTKLK